jgi:hypothetical protein
MLLLQVHEEEWSYIPVGGPLPVGDQPLTAFGAAANLVHPATGANTIKLIFLFSGVSWVARCMLLPGSLRAGMCLVV